jgi:hypothetical protein
MPLKETLDGLAVFAPVALPVISLHLSAQQDVSQTGIRLNKSSAEKIAG